MKTRGALFLAGVMPASGSLASAQSSAPATDPVAAGQAAYDRGDYKSALAAWQPALGALESAKAPRTGDVFLGIGEAYYSLHDYLKALDAFREALARYRERKNALGEANALNDLGSVENDLARYDDVLTSLKQALKTERSASPQIDFLVCVPQATPPGLRGRLKVPELV
jgi:tetratricopeptide (TPR) repeat protein